MGTIRTSLKGAFGHSHEGPQISCSGRGELIGTCFVAIMVTAAAWMLLPPLEEHAWRLPYRLPFALAQYGPKALALAVTLLAALAVLRAMLDWRKLGPATLTMDPWPAGLGGELGGVIQLATRPASGDRIALVLQCIRRRRSGTGRNSSWQETVLWEDEGLPVIEAGARGGRLVLRFPLPVDHPASETSGNEQIHWRLYLEADLGRHHLKRSFTVPVDAQPGSSTSLTTYPLTPSRPITESLPPREVREIRERGGTTFLFPAFRHLRVALSWAIFGLGFFGLTGGFMLWLWLTGDRDAPPVMFPVVFLLVGTLTLLPLFWLPFSMRVTATPEGLTVRRHWLGMPVGHRQLGAHEISSFATHSGNQIRIGDGRQEVRYHLLALSDSGRRIRCSAGLPGQTLIRLYETRLRRALGLGK